MQAPAEEPIYFYTKSMAYWGLSNFSPPGFEADGAYWQTVEHYYQAQKFTDPEMRERIRRAVTPKDARSLGQTRSSPVREDWDSVREEVMLFALRRKFREREAGQLLLSTGSRILVESSPYDYFWGAGADGSGESRLGQLLMQVREEIRGNAV